MTGRNFLFKGNLALKKKAKKQIKKKVLHGALGLGKSLKNASEGI
jgi:hypothetical protein